MKRYNRKAKIIIGLNSLRVNDRAKKEAEKIAGYYKIISWDEIRGKFGPGWALNFRPGVVIIQDLPLRTLQKGSPHGAYIKEMILSDDIVIERKYEMPQKVPAPLFIFTMFVPPGMDLPLISRYFDVVEVTEEAILSRMAQHELKISPEHFDAVWIGDKNFEVRLNDRDYRLHDLLILRECINEKEYTGRVIKARVVYVFDDLGLQKDWIVMGIKEMARYESSSAAMIDA